MKQKEMNQLVKAVAQHLKEQKAVKKTGDKKKDCIAWFEKNLGVKMVKNNFKVQLPTKAGTKTYEAVKFDNGRTAVFIKGGNVLKYAWNE